MRRVRLISFGITMRPKSSTRLTIPVAFIYLLLDYEHELKSWSAEQTMDCYVELLKAEMAKATNRKQYWSVIQHLKNISKYPDGKQATQALARFWKEYHYNRPAMKDELRKAGF